MQQQRSDQTVSHGKLGLDRTKDSRVGEKRPVGANSATKFIRLDYIVGADSNELTIANLQLMMELNEPCSLPALLGAETPAAENENHWVLSLQFGELPAFPDVVEKLIVGEDGTRNNVRSHVELLFNSG